MTVRSTTLLKLAIVFAVMTLAISLVARVMVLSSFEKLEEQELLAGLARVENELRDEASRLVSYTVDWGEWSDTYDYAVDRSSAYVDENLQAPYIINLNIDGFLFLNLEGEVFNVVGVDYETEDFTPIPETVVNDIVGANSIWEFEEYREDSRSGLVLAGGGLVIYAANPILESNGYGPSRGTLIAINYLDTNAIVAMGKKINTNLDIYLHKNGNIAPKDISVAAEGLNIGKKVVVTRNGDETIAIYKHLKDKHGQPVAIVKVSAPRLLYAEGSELVTLFTLGTVAIGFLFLAVLMMVLDTNVLRRIADLASELPSLRDRSEEIDYNCEDKEDEINQLTEAVYDMVNDKNHLINKLKMALSEVRKLSGLLPLCSYCKNVRDDEGYWHQVEAYISEHTDADITHGICPDCYENLLKDEGLTPKKEKLPLK